MFIAVLLADRKLTAVIFAWAAVNSYSRLYLGVHYPSDLIAGAAIGIAFGWGMALLAGRVARKFRTAHPDSPARLSGIPSAVCILTVIGITLHAVLSLLRQP